MHQHSTCRENTGQAWTAIARIDRIASNARHFRLKKFVVPQNLERNTTIKTERKFDIKNQ
jgi:hypothetical protein